MARLGSLFFFFSHRWFLNFLFLEGKELALAKRREVELKMCNKCDILDYLLMAFITIGYTSGYDYIHEILSHPIPSSTNKTAQIHKSAQQNRILIKLYHIYHNSSGSI
jgi:hypothetical protein